MPNAQIVMLMIFLATNFAFKKMTLYIGIIITAKQQKKEALEDVVNSMPFVANTYVKKRKIDSNAPFFKADIFNKCIFL